MCRQIYSEAGRIYYAKNKFTFYDSDGESVLALARMLRPGPRDAVQHLVFEERVIPLMLVRRMLSPRVRIPRILFEQKPLTGWFPNLQSVQLDEISSYSKPGIQRYDPYSISRHSATYSEVRDILLRESKESVELILPGWMKQGLGMPE